jgi:hypothetical protein
MEAEVVEEVYPILVVPQSIRELGPVKDQSPDDAKKAFDWTMSTLKNRIDGLLKFFDLEYPMAGSEYQFLIDLGIKISAELRREPNLRLTDNGAEPTAPGLSMAYDSGLFVGDLVIRSSDGAVRWTLQLEGDKNRLEYNKAVLSGKPERLKIEPIRSIMAEARLIVQGLDLQMMWAWRYVACLITLTSDVRLRPEEMLSRAHALGFPLEDYREISKREWAKARKAGGPYLRRPTSPLSK